MVGTAPTGAAAGSSVTPVTAHAGNSRRHELNWLRVLVVLGLIPYHAAVDFAVGPEGYIKSSQRNLPFLVQPSLSTPLGLLIVRLLRGFTTWCLLLSAVGSPRDIWSRARLSCNLQMRRAFPFMCSICRF